MQIIAMEPGAFGVQLTEAQGVETSHRVKVPDTYVDQLGLSGVDHEAIVRETLLFLLEREPATAIGDELDLPDVERRFPEYRDEIAARLAGVGG